jgi:FRG domain-containing protein
VRRLITTYAVDSSEEAVALAERFREEDRYDLFRGQRKNRPVVPTFARRNKEQVEVAQERLKLFFYWLQEQPELAALADRQDPAIVDQMYAVAQHYGLPTLFCDFTFEPRVAGFFASSEEGSEGGTSVIVCCNSKELISWCEPHFLPEMRLPEVLNQLLRNSRRKLGRSPQL